MLFGQRLGDPLGIGRIRAYSIEPINESIVKVMWPAMRPDDLFHIFINGGFYKKQSETEVVVLSERPISSIDIFRTSSQNEDEDLEKFVKPNIGSVLIIWDPVDAEYYEIWRGTQADPFNNAGEMIAKVKPFSSQKYYYYDDNLHQGLPDGTYYYAVVSVDQAGNKTVSTDVVKQINLPPLPPTNLQVIGL